MPAAAVIPAPIAYIKVAAVKKLVVGFQSNLWGPLIKGLDGNVRFLACDYGYLLESFFLFPGGYIHSV